MTYSIEVMSDDWLVRHLWGCCDPAGVGFALLQKAQTLQPEAMFAYIVAVGVCGIVLNAVLVGVVAVLFRGQMAAAGETA